MTTKAGASACLISDFVQNGKKILMKAVNLIQVIGKALVLDEIINYIQSLQRQVEVYEPLVFLCF